MLRPEEAQGQNYEPMNRNAVFVLWFSLFGFLCLNLTELSGQVSGGGGTLYRFDGPAQYNELGNSVACAGDVDGDGVNDLIVGAPATGYWRGKVYVYSGANGNTLWEFEGAVSSGLFGDSVSNAGDFNQDGHDDFIIAAANVDSQRRQPDRRRLRLLRRAGIRSSALAGDTPQAVRRRGSFRPIRRLALRSRGRGLLRGRDHRRVLYELNGRFGLRLFRRKREPPLQGRRRRALYYELHNSSHGETNIA